jgi:ADP-heptose:LPS heptosyltransferase
MTLEVELVDVEGDAGPFADPKPSMRGRYLIRSSARKARVMGMIDAVLDILPRTTPEIPPDPERILIANWAHLGDVVTTFGAITALRERYPKAHIGMIVASWGKPAIAAAGLVDTIHVIDHWKLSRANISRREMKERYKLTRRIAMREIKDNRYQIAIDLFAFFPQAHPLFYSAGIPVRIGYTSGGFGPLLTHPVPWTDAERPMGDQYRDLLDMLSPLKPFSASALRPRRDRATLVPLPSEVKDGRPYLVIHPGAGSQARYWGNGRWEELIRELGGGKGPFRIVLTGAGVGEIAVAGDLKTIFPDLVDLSGRVDWEEFVSVLAHAALVICPDTATGHVAALFDVPIVSIFTGTNSPMKWAPYGERVHVLVKPVLCAPCHTVGCEAMACFRGIPPERVAMAARGLLGLASS